MGCVVKCVLYGGGLVVRGALLSVCCMGRLIASDRVKGADRAIAWDVLKSALSFLGQMT